jgi:hypothetical protein
MRYDAQRERELRQAFNDLALGVVQLMDAARNVGLGGVRLADAGKELGQIAARIYRSLCDDPPP